MTRIARRALLGLLVASTAHATMISDDGRPDAVLEIAVERDRARDALEPVGRALAAMGFARVEMSLQVPPTVVVFTHPDDARVTIYQTETPGHLVVTIYTLGQHAWKPVGAEIIRVVQTLPYCTITGLGWQPKALR